MVVQSITNETTRGNNASAMRTGIDSAHLSVGNGDGIVTTQEQDAFALQFQNLVNKHDQAFQGTWANLTIDGRKATNFTLETYRITGAEGPIDSQSPLHQTFVVRMTFDEDPNVSVHTGHFEGSILRNGKGKLRATILSVSVRTMEPLRIQDHHVIGESTVTNPNHVMVEGNPLFSDFTFTFATNQNTTPMPSEVWCLVVLAVSATVLRRGRLHL